MENVWFNPGQNMCDTAYPPSGGISPVARTTTPVDCMHAEDKMNADKHE